MIRPSLDVWIRDAEELRHLEHLQRDDLRATLYHVRTRADDLYIALVGQLFEAFRSGAEFRDDSWARLGNALGQYAAPELAERRLEFGIDAAQAGIFSAAAFFCGGFPASAYLTMRNIRLPAEAAEVQRACFDLLARPTRMRSRTADVLHSALARGDTRAIGEVLTLAEREAATALPRGPDEWIPAKLLLELLRRFVSSNIRTVLPEGDSGFWDTLARSFLARRPPVWDYFPSQIQAIQSGLIDSSDSYALQMPTGSGKTTLCETLLYWHAKRNPTDVAVFLVPYRSLATELRSTIVRSLNRMGISARCAYGGTVPSREEVRNLEAAQVLVCTPEALSGLLGAERDFFHRVSLVICDEGHLLDERERGVALELLLSRFRSRTEGPPRFVFMSAIVPNVEEINAWLGGSPDSVVRSEYRPAVADFGLLIGEGSGAGRQIALEMNPHLAAPSSYSIDPFLDRSDFMYRKASTGRLNTYSFGTVKAKAVAAARKALPMGPAVIFAANKHGSQGATGIGRELLAQLGAGIGLPAPRTWLSDDAIQPALDYVTREFGSEWLGTRLLAEGAVLHHGDIPQETREVVEQLVRDGHLRLAICTKTLAEGVNLPIRTLVLYSVRRRTRSGRPVDFLARDIKNLVGRAGRAGATTRGLVICSNPSEWGLVARVARQEPGEEVTGALRKLVHRLERALALRSISLTNAYLESAPSLFSLVDGVDATLVSLAAEELGSSELEALAIRLADETLASRKLAASARGLMKRLFLLRAERIHAMEAAGRLAWARDTGAPPRLVDIVESQLLPARDDWHDIDSPTDRSLVDTLVSWSLQQSSFSRRMADTYRLERGESTEFAMSSLREHLIAWLEGKPFRAIAERSGRSVDEALLVHGGLVAYDLQVRVEQGVSVLQKLLESRNLDLSPTVLAFPDYLRFGVATGPSLLLAEHGVRHRSAAAHLGASEEVTRADGSQETDVIGAALGTLRAQPELWIQRLGQLVVDRTLQDLAPR